ncbi:MAG: hypothetical protein ABI972_14810 [Acidobacteriota bacterium]
MIRSLLAVLLLAAAGASAVRADETKHPIPEIKAALERMYSFDFQSAHRMLDLYVASHPSEPLGPAFKASAYLFYEMDRMKILEGEFLVNDNRIKSNKRIDPDPKVRELFYQNISLAEGLAAKRLQTSPNDPSALFTLCMVEGMKTDYLAFIEKERMKSLSNAKQSQEHAIELRKRVPEFYDALLTSGISEYMIGSLPFFVKWFIRFPETDGDKGKAIENLQTVSRKGYYMGPFARILLAIIHLREKQPLEAKKMLEILTKEYPANPLLKREYEHLRLKYPDPAIRQVGQE